MSGHKPFKRLRDKLRSTPEGQVAVQQEQHIVRSMLALADMRVQRGMTQVELANAWDVSQANISRVEHGEDIYLSTLRRYVAALGGRLEMRAVFPDQVIVLNEPEDHPVS